MGNRIAKHIYNAQSVWEKSTYYVRDASGNTMATYEKTTEQAEIEGNMTTLTSCKLTERHIYGSSRLGMDTEQVEMISPILNTPYSIPNTQYPIQRTLGQKQYEISNHLGNVLTVVNDIKLPITETTGTGENEVTTIVSYSAVVVSATDYSPFGVALYGRSWSNDNYRYGFNGKEKDKEGMGGGSQTYDYGFRIYNPALAKFLSVDPLANCNHVWSDYTYAADNPVLIVDIDGKWWGITTTFFAEFQASAGLCYGVNYLVRTGVTIDAVGTTHFTVSNAVYIINQNLDEGQNAQPIIGATVSGNVGVAFSASETFDQLVGGHITLKKNTALALGLPKLGDLVKGKLNTPDISLRAGIGFAVSEFGYEISAGLQAGVLISVLQITVDESISVTDAEEDKIDELIGLPVQKWSVADSPTPEQNVGGGETVSFVSQIVANGINTGIEIHCGAIKNEKGEIVPDNVWYTYEYANAAREANKEEN